MMKLIGVLVSVFSLAAVPARAELLVEPTVSGSLGTLTEPGTPPLSYKFMMFQPGLRVGYREQYIHVTGVIDPTISKLLSGTLTGAKLIVWNLGIGVGWEWNIPMRTYVVLGTPFSYVDIGYYVNPETVVAFRLGKRFAKSDTQASMTFGLALSYTFSVGYPEKWWRDRQ